MRAAIRAGCPISCSAPIRPKSSIWHRKATRTTFTPCDGRHCSKALNAFVFSAVQLLFLYVHRFGPHSSPGAGEAARISTARGAGMARHGSVARGTEYEARAGTGLSLGLLLFAMGSE